MTVVHKCAFIVHYVLSFMYEYTNANQLRAEYELLLNTLTTELEEPKVVEFLKKTLDFTHKSIVSVHII